MDLSVIIPTFRRPEALLRTLDSLQAQTLGGFEILVTDNAADPAVARAVQSFNRTARTPAAYRAEPRLGVHFARNGSAARARGSLLLFTDDDMTFEPAWVEGYARVFRDHPEMAAAAGPVRPKWESPPPGWLVDYIGGARTFTPLSFMEPRDDFALGRDGFFYSCNMAIRRDVLAARGGFHPENTGGIWVGDGESGLNRDMWRAGDVIGYVPKCVAYHHIPPRRMTVEYLRLRMENEGAAEAYAAFHRSGPTALAAARFIAGVASRNVRHLAAGWAFRGRTDRRGLNIQLRRAFALSQMRYAWRLMRDERFRALVRKADWYADEVEAARSTIPV